MILDFTLSFILVLIPLLNSMPVGRDKNAGDTRFSHVGDK